jgi:tetratricopeptide (TPR) repeat protein
VENMKKIIFFILIFLSTTVYSMPNNDEFVKGCDFYKNGEYENALEQFKSLEEINSGENILYNIGNTYFRLGKVGLALVYYERAKRISPFDDDINFNIKFLSGMINDPDYEQTLISKMDLTKIKLFLSIFLFVFLIFVSIKLVMPDKRVFWFLIISFVFLVFFSIIYSIKYKQSKTIEAVVITNSAEIRSGPDNNFKVNFTLPEGKKVVILNLSGGWVEVGVKSLGIRGWLESKYIEII